MMDLDADLDLIRQAAIDAGALAIAEREAGLKIESKGRRFARHQRRPEG